MFLITGYGRSGTHFVSAVLKQIGVDAPHETEGLDGIVSWKHIVPGTFVLVGKGRSQVIPEIEYDHICHQVRDPLKVIASAQTFSESTFQYMERNLGIESRHLGVLQKTFFPERVRRQRLERAMKTWLGWNALIENRAEWRYRIEDFQEIFPEFLDRLGLSEQAFPAMDRQKRDSRIGRKGYKEVSWDELRAIDEGLAKAVGKKAADYGYEVP